MDTNTGIEREELTPFDFLSGEKEETNDLTEEISKDEIQVQDEIKDEDEGQAKVEVEDEIEEEEVTPDDLKVKVKGNLAKYAADALKAQGALPEDFEVADDITEEGLNSAYVAYKEETLRNQITDEVRKSFEEEQGLTPQMIEEIKLKHYGVQDPELQQLQYLKYLSDYKFDESADSFEDDATNFLTSYYTLKNISENRIGKLVSVDLEDNSLMDIIAEAQSELSGQSVEMDTSIKARVQEQVQARQQSKIKLKEDINGLLAAKTINGTSYSDEEMNTVRKALFDKTEIVQGPDGKKYRVTLFKKKEMESQQSLEKDLERRIQFILGSNPREIRKDESGKTAKKMLNKLNDYIDIDVKKSRKKAAAKGSIERVELTR